LKVELLHVSGRDLDIAQYARISHGHLNKYSDEDNKKLLRKLFRLGHHEPFEFLNMIFRVECSIVAERQLLRHRVGISKVERSLRYVKLQDAGNFYIPPELSKETQERVKQFYEKAFKLYKELLNETSAQLARYILPLGTNTIMHIQFNARSLYHFLELRLQDHVQPETRELAKAFLEVLASKEETKNLYELFSEKFLKEG